MDPPEALHGAIFGSNTSSAKRIASGQHGQDPPSTVRSGPQAPIPYPASTVTSNTQGPSQYLHSPLGGTGAQPASPYVPPRFRDNIPPPPPYLPSAVASHVNPPSAAPMQHRTAEYHHPRLPTSNAFNPFVPPMENTVRSLPSDTGLNPSLLPPKSIASAMPLQKMEVPSLEAQQPDTKKRRPSNNNDKSAVQKRPKTSEARPVQVRQPEQYEENDVRAKAPESWDEVKLIQQVLESAVRSFARVTASTPPKVSPWGSYRDQRDAFQAALDRYWRLDNRPGPPPELAGIGPWYGPMKSIINAPVVITEDDLEHATHPSVASFQPVPGSIAWLERTQNFEYLLQNQLDPSVNSQPRRLGHHGIRASVAQPMSLQVDHQVVHEEIVTPYQVGALVAREIEARVPTNNSHSMLPTENDEPAKSPY